jgi:hypothetical protein
VDKAGDGTASSVVGNSEPITPDKLANMGSDDLMAAAKSMMSASAEQE